jgi:tetratricopeptide (TPR) repeat protein
MRPLAPIVALMLLTGLAGPAAADDRSACARRSGPPGLASCGVTWQMAAREGERPTNTRPTTSNPAGARPTPARLDDENVCFGGGSGGVEDWISACDRLIAARNVAPSRLLAFYRYRGNWHQLKRDHTRAVADYDEVIRHEPGNALALTSRKASLRAICLGSGEPAARIGACTRFIGELAAGDNDLPVAHLTRAEIYRKSGDLGRAGADLEAALRIDPRDRAALEAKAALARTTTAGQPAASPAAQTPEKPPGPRGSAEDRAKCFSTERSEAAVAACNRLITAGVTGRDLALAHAYRGSNHRTKDNLAQALADYDEAVRTFPEHGLLTNRGSTLVELKQYDRAITDYDEAIRLNQNSVEAFRGRATAYHRKGDLARALADLDQLLTLDGKDVSGLVSRGLIHIRQGEFDRALTDLNEAIRLKPEQWMAWNNRGFAYYRKGDFARALADYEEVLRLAPRNVFGLNGRGAALNGLGAYDRAIAAFEEAIEIAPEYANPYKNRGVSFEGKGQWEKALADFRKAATLDTTLTEAMDGVNRVEKLAAAGAKRIAAAEPTRDPVAPVTAPQTSGSPGLNIAALPATPLAAPTPVAPGSRVALVVGNADYRHATRLANPVNDAGDVAAALRRLGFDVVEGRDLDKRAMEEKAREFGRKLDRAELALFFYAGHGLQVAGKNYLVPTDAKLERPGDLSFEAIEITQILAQMEADQRVNLVFLDACRDNPLARSLARSYGARSSAVGQGLATIQSAIGTMISYATQPDAVALDGDGRNSPFTSALLKHIATRGLEIGSLMRRVRADVVQVTRGKQVPWDHSSLIGDVVLAQ